MTHLTAGAIAMGFGIAGLFFLRFWRRTHDRLFALFALAFFVLAINRAAGYWDAGPVDAPQIAVPDARNDHMYWVRFVAFCLILVAIIDKNRARKP